MNYSLKGPIHHIGPTTILTPTFRKRDLVVTVQDGKYTQLIKIEAVNDQADALDSFAAGTNVNVSFNLRGREHNGKFYTSLIAWRIKPELAETPANQHQSNPPDEDDQDEIPL